MISVFWQWQRQTWRGFWRERAIILPFCLSLGVLLAAGAIIQQTTGLNDQSFVLRYSIYVGTNLVTDPSVRWWLFYIAAGVLIINVILGYITARRSLIIKHIWLWGTVALELGFLWFVWLLRVANG